VVGHHAQAKRDAEVKNSPFAVLYLMLYHNSKIACKYKNLPTTRPNDDISVDQATAVATD
jgi:hypothetical protein